LRRFSQFATVMAMNYPFTRRSLFVAANHPGAPFDGFELRLGPEQDQLQGHSEFGGDERSSADAGIHFAESR